MIPRLNFFFSIEPKTNNKSQKKFSWYGYVFKPIWTYKNFNISKKLRITVNQGVCGKVYEKGNSIIGVEFEDTKTHDFNFNDEQKELTEHLTIVLSCPIIQSDTTEGGKKNKVIAVLNFESETVNAKKLIIDPALKKEFHENIVWLSEICSDLL